MKGIGRLVGRANGEAKECTLLEPMRWEAFCRTCSTLPSSTCCYRCEVAYLEELAGFDSLCSSSGEVYRAVVLRFHSVLRFSLYRLTTAVILRINDPDREQSYPVQNSLGEEEPIARPQSRAWRETVRPIVDQCGIIGFPVEQISRFTTSSRGC